MPVAWFTPRPVSSVERASIAYTDGRLSVAEYAAIVRRHQG